MADLSAVLRKTIDGLPRATPDLRAKVYEKARAAIQRQIDSAEPPLAPEVVETRRSALDDAIARTEAHYAGLEPAGAAEPAPLAAVEAARPAPAMPKAPSLATPVIPKPQAPDPQSRYDAPVAEPRRPEPSTFERSGGRRPAAQPERREPEMEPRGARPLARPPLLAETEPAAGLDASVIPNADTTAPRYSGARRTRAASAGRSRKPVYAGIAALVVVAGLGAAGYVYRDRLGASSSQDAAGEQQASATPPTTTQPPASETPADTTAPATGAATPDAGKRRFTQRLMPDGSEVNEGPGTGAPNAFDEGTNIAAATPEPTPQAATGAAPAGEAATDAPATDTATSPPPAAEGSTPPATTAPVPNAATADVTTPAVAQKVMFYEERTDNSPGTQQTGSVVWSVVNEPPAEGQPAEPAIRAVAEVPSEKLRLTMTVRRNLDATLPASHVIELMFDVPAGFPGGQISNVQRLALKPTEEARGAPLIGVAGKISDGFFIIALNNLAEASQANLELLQSQEWIDIPIAYATGRRALLSIEKGIPGDRIFKEVIADWASKT